MKRKFALFSLVLCLVMVFSGCATTGNQPAPPPLTQQQQDALASLAGNGLGIALANFYPQSAVPAKTFCANFLKAEDMLAAQTILENGLVYLGAKYDATGKLAPVAKNALQIIGFNEAQIAAFLQAKGDEVVKIQGFTAEMWRKSQLVVVGFCQVI